MIQETRHWDEEAGVTHAMRSKEGSSDYRYFTEPDLVPVVMTPEWVAGIENRLPELPAQRRARYAAQGLAEGTAGVLSALDADMRRLYDEAVISGAAPGSAANWITGEVVAWLRRAEVEARDACPRRAWPCRIDRDGGRGVRVELSRQGGARRCHLGRGSPEEVAESRDLLQVSDAGTLETAVAEVLAANPRAIEEFRAGEEKVVGFLVGQVMKATGGKADPRLVNQLIREKMSG